MFSCRESNGDSIQTTHLHPTYAVPVAIPCSPSTTTPTTAELSRQLEEVVISDVDDKQRARLEGFLQKKKELGEPRGDDDFEKQSELGAGNGGRPFSNHDTVFSPERKPKGQFKKMSFVIDYEQQFFGNLCMYIFFPISKIFGVLKKVVYN